MRKKLRLCKRFKRDRIKNFKSSFSKINSSIEFFLSPKRQDKQYERRNKTKSRIGEENELLSYVRDYIKVKFPKEYEEFNKLTFDYELNHDSKIKNITWGLNKGIKRKKVVINKDYDKVN